jgi:hypothetical protein
MSTKINMFNYLLLIFQYNKLVKKKNKSQKNYY